MQLMDFFLVRLWKTTDIFRMRARKSNRSLSFASVGPGDKVLSVHLPLLSED